DSNQVVESYKSGFEPPGDVEFEDYGQAMKRAASETSLSNTREGKEKPPGKTKPKLWPFIKNKNKLMSLLTSPHQPPPAPPASSPPSPSAVPNDPQSPKQHKEPLSHRLNDFMASKPKMHCLRSLRRGHQPRVLVGVITSSHSNRVAGQGQVIASLPVIHFTLQLSLTSGMGGSLLTSTLCRCEDDLAAVTDSVDGVWLMARRCELKNGKRMAGFVCAITGLIAS
ncbi:formin-binding protein 1 isoform X1, partial [Lates japonicus]